MRDALFPECPMSTWYDTLLRLNITYKKEPAYKQRSQAKRDQFMIELSKTTISNHVYIDEMGIDDIANTVKY